MKKSVARIVRKRTTNDSVHARPTPAAPVEPQAKREEKKPGGSRPYVVTSHQDGLYYAKSVPADESGQSAQGTTKVYRVGRDGDELLDTYPWYAPRGVKTGMLLDWSPTAGKVAIMRMHDEDVPFAMDRVELTFYLGGKLLKSYTVKDLAALGVRPVAQAASGVMRRWLGYGIAGNWTFGPERNHR